MTDAPRGIPDARREAAKLGVWRDGVSEENMAARFAELQRETILGLAAECRRLAAEATSPQENWKWVERAEWLEQEARSTIIDLTKALGGAND